MNENAVYLMVPKDIFKIGYSVKMSAESDDTAEVMLYGEIVGDVGCMYNIGPGSLSMAQPIILSSISDFPTWADAIITICQIPGCVKLSMISR